jgi:hypothetical protein
MSGIVPRPKHVLPSVEVAQASAAQRDHFDARMKRGLEAAADPASERKGEIDGDKVGLLKTQLNAADEDSRRSSSNKQSLRLEGGSKGGHNKGFELTQNTSTISQNSSTNTKRSVAGHKGVIPNLSPSTKVVDVEQMYRTFQFKSDGPGQFQEGLRSPEAGLFARRTATNSVARAKELFDKKILTFPEANAFQHTLWSFEVTRNFGPEIAKKFGDAHERTVVNNDSDRLKDLFNNYVGRFLATDPANQKRPAEEVVLEAVRAGKLQIDPVRVPPPPAGVLQPPPRRRPL